MEFELRFNRQDYEYDIYGLIRAFFPEMDLHIRYTGTVDSSNFSMEQYTGTVDSSNFSMEYRDRDAVFSWDLPPVLFPGRPACARPDLRARAPERVTGRVETAVTDWNDRFETKNELKRMVYRALRELTGRELPWGALTGIRPVKLARWRLEAGDTRQGAERHMREHYFTSSEKAALAVDIAERELELTAALDLKRGYSLYIGIPFCPSICLYCSFGSHPLAQWQESVAPYLQALKEELSFIAQACGGRGPTAIYIGGGTPTSLAAEQLRDLLAHVRGSFDLTMLREFTVEAGRPDTVTQEKLAVIREGGATRISINPQTMQQSTLERIGRAHTVEQTETAFALAREMGFDNINMDMIVGLPGEGEAEVVDTLRHIEQMGPDNLTVHSLALKRAARLHLFREEYAEISFGNSAGIMDSAAKTAQRLGMRPYYLYRQKYMAGNFENVGYARPGREGLYNILIMEELQTIIGAGSGATTKFVYDRGRSTERAENVKSISEYIGRAAQMRERKREGFRKFFEGNAVQ